MNNRTEMPAPRTALASMNLHLQIPVDTTRHIPALASKCIEVHAKPHDLRVHEWQLNVSSASASQSVVSQPSAFPTHRSAFEPSAKAFSHAANAFETRVATLLMYNAAHVKRM